MILYYIGPGKKGTGDWCFSDGFISFREIMDTYTQHFRGRVLTIVSDCSYSGSWVREAMTFMDEQGVGPCGHAAKEKGILIKVFASCQANEIPAKLAFSTHCAQNDKKTGQVSYKLTLCSSQVHDHQHPSGIDFTEIQCKHEIDQPCTMAPGSTWQKWVTAKKVFLVRGKDNDRPVWHYVLLADYDDAVRSSREKMRRESINVEECGQIIESGWGQDPPEDVVIKLQEKYGGVNYDCLNVQT